MVAMKHVGLNVAADSFINSAVTGINGGLIVVSADDPSMHSSQNEQDSRFYGKFAFVPVFEPSDQQEAYDMVFDAFEVSEKYKLPVLFRITTRLAHSRAGVKRQRKRNQNVLSLPSDLKQFILLPAIARRKYKKLLDVFEVLKSEELVSARNTFTDGTNKKIGIIASGIAYNYLMENFPGRAIDYPVIKISAYPFSKELIRKITDQCEAVLVLEEGFPMIEEQLRGILDSGIKIFGRLDGTVPRDGELNPGLVAKAIGLQQVFGKEVPELVKMRPPSFCKGCGHADTYLALNESLTGHTPGRVFF